jgi:hypothetical protein
MKSLPLPFINSDWWTIARSPDLGRLNGVGQQAMDFSVWRAADKTWQLGACVRNTAVGGEGRLLFRWEAARLSQRDWLPAGCLLQAEPSFGEKKGGLQAPFVIQDQGRYLMFYGGWSSIGLATSNDGKTFARQLNKIGQSALFSNASDALLRDPTVVHWGEKFYLYYTHVENGQGVICARCSADLSEWSDDSLLLFRWDSRGTTTIYRSSNPLDFGVDNDRYKVGELPYEVVRILREDDDFYLTSLHEDYSGIRLARMHWQ